MSATYCGVCQKPWREINNVMRYDCTCKNSYHVTINTDEAVNHPKHYTSHPSGIERIEITRHMNFNCGNAVKYVWRNGIKSSDITIQDLEKAIWYLNDEIARLCKLKAG